MTDFTSLRAQLADEHTAMNTRLEHLETDMQSQGVDLADTGPDRITSRGELARRVEFIVAEARRIEAALWRIDRREYDCCILCGGRIATGRLENAPLAATCAECSKSYGVEYDTTLRVQHHSLRSLIDDTQDAITGMTRRLVENAPGAKRDVSAACVLLMDLERELAAHHAAEEKHGFLSPALSLAPRFHSKAEQLRLEHAELIGALRYIVRGALRADTDAAEWRRISAQLADTGADIRVHEELENELVTGAYLDDVGTAD